MNAGAQLVLVDSNILIYRRDASEALKRDRALAVTQSLLDSDRMALGVQSLTEFYRVSTERLPIRLPAALAREDVQLFVRYVLCSTSRSMSS